MVVKDIILFDGHCSMCNGFTKFLEKRLSNSSNVRFVGLESEEGVNIHSKFPNKIKEVDSIILVRKDKLYIRSAAGIRTLLYLKKTWVWMFPFAWIIPLPIRDLVYIIIAKTRYKIKSNRTCDSHL